MIKLEKKQVKIISILIALVFMGSVVALALTQTGSVASAASSGSVGVVNQQEVFAGHPDLENIRTQMQNFAQDVQKEYEEKSAGMSDQEKQDYARQCAQRVQQKEQELLEPVMTAIEAAVKKVADQKGLAVVITKEAVIYGGQDITQDVIKALAKK